MPTITAANIFAIEDLYGPKLNLGASTDVTGVLVSGIPTGMVFSQTGSSAGLPAGTLRFTKKQLSDLAVAKLPANSDTDRQLTITPLVDAPSKITVRVSGDAGAAPPKMALYVDGVQVGATISVTASHSAGQWQDITFQARLKGKSTIKVGFLNDDGPTNLWVDSLSVNGQKLAPSAGTYTYGSTTITGQSAMNWQGSLVWKTSLLAPSLIDQQPATANATKMWVNVDAAADMPTLSAGAASGSIGTWIKLPIKAALTDTDGTETLSIKIANLPDGAALRSGTTTIAVTDHKASVTPAQLANLELKGATAGTLSLQVSATATEKALLGQSGYYEGNLANNVATKTVTETVTLSGTAAPPPTTTTGAEYLKDHRFFADSSPWNTKLGLSVTYTDVATIENYPLVLTSWLKDGGNVSIFYASATDPLRQVYSNPDTWVKYYEGSWLRAGNNATVEKDIMAHSTETNPYPANPYSTQKADLYWYNGGLPASYDKADPGPTYARIPDAALPTNTTDGYTVVIQPDGNALEMYSPIKLSNGNWTALMHSFTPALTGQGIGSENGRTASMVENYAGALRDRDFTSATIDHALALVTPPSMLTTKFTGTALAFDSNPNYSGTLAMGSRLALPKDLDINSLGLTTDLGRKVATAAKDYGMIVVDRGGTGFCLVTENNPKTAAMNTWNWEMQKDLDTIIHHAALANWQ